MRLAVARHDRALAPVGAEVERVGEVVEVGEQGQREGRRRAAAHRASGCAARAGRSSAPSSSQPNDQRRHELAGVVAVQAPGRWRPRPTVGHRAAAVQRAPEKEEGERLEEEDLGVGDAEAAEVDGGAADGEQQGGEQRGARAEQLARQQVGGAARRGCPSAPTTGAASVRWRPKQRHEQALQRQADHRPGVPAHAEEVGNAPSW